jgi:chemotaxis protein methyltransferase CheR
MVVRTIESIGSQDLRTLLTTIREAYGYDFTEYAEASMKRRSLYFMNSRNIKDVHELLQLLLKDEAIFEEFVRNISVTVTEMFRDPGFYSCLREKVMKRLATYPFIKIWVAGCATGEEVYSIAILLKEEGLLSRSLIYATDINQYSLHQAKEGIFPIDLMKAYTANYQKSGGQKDFSTYYVAQYNAALFDRSLRNNVVFAPHNLATDQSFNEFQLILCRNVLIYFNQELQNRVMNLFYDSLCTFGILGLGNKESLLFTDKQKCFERIDNKEKIFIKTV